MKKFDDLKPIEKSAVLIWTFLSFVPFILFSIISIFLREFSASVLQILVVNTLMFYLGVVLLSFIGPNFSEKSESTLQNFAGPGRFLVKIVIFAVSILSSYFIAILFYFLDLLFRTFVIVVEWLLVVVSLLVLALALMWFLS